MTTRPEPGPSGRGSRPGRRGACRPGLAAGVAAVAVGVLGLGGTAFALSGPVGSQPPSSGRGAGSASLSSTAGPSTVSIVQPAGSTAAVTADATVTPAATTSACATPVTFTLSGTVSATAAGTVTYQWIGSPGLPAQVRTLRFSGAGTQRVTGAAVRFKTAGTHWAAIKIVSPRAVISNRATYILGCSRRPVTVSATAAVTPAHTTVGCGKAPPSATFTGTIHDAKAGKVTYYWELPTGNGPVRSLTFTAPGTKPAARATVAAASDSSTESGTLVVLSPAPVSSKPATFSVSCTQPAPPPQYYVQIVPPAGYNEAEFGTVGGPVATTMTANYGTRPYRWSSTGLPPGLAIDAATGTISGTPTTGGTYRPRVTVTDSSSPVESYSLEFAFVVSYPPVVTSAPPLPDGTVGVAYPGVTFSATGGDGDYDWYLALGNQPPGLSMSASGVLGGTPTTAGTFIVNAIVDDSSGDSGTAVRTLVINPAQ